MTRIDPDAMRKTWPVLYEAGTPKETEFVLRDAEVVIAQNGIDSQEIEKLAGRFRCTSAGLVLQIVFEFVYGSYLLTGMRRTRTGLFKGFPATDPAPWSSFEPDAQGLFRIAVPHRLRVDLDSLAERQGIETEQLAGLLVRRYMEGHLEPRDWPGSAKEQ